MMMRPGRTDGILSHPRQTDKHWVRIGDEALASPLRELIADEIQAAPYDPFFRIMPVAAGEAMTLDGRAKLSNPSAGGPQFDARPSAAVDTSADQIAPVTDEMMASSQPVEQIMPTVTALAGGGYAMTWFAAEDIGAETIGLYGRVFQNDGTPLAPEFEIGFVDDAGRSDTALTALTGGGFVAAWTYSTGAGRALMVRRYDSSGQPLDEEPTLVTDAPSCDDPRLAATADGGYVLIFTADPSANEPESLTARRYDANGTEVARFGLSGPANFIDNAEITVLSDGALVVGWDETGGADGSVAKMRIFEPDGTPRTGQIIFASTDSPPLSIAALADGGFAYVSASQAAPGQPVGTYVQRYDASANPIGMRYALGEDSGDGAAYVIGLAGGGFAIARGEDDNQNYRLDLFGADGQLEGDPFLVNQTPDSNPGAITGHNVAQLSNGEIVVAWAGRGAGSEPNEVWDIFMRRFEIDDEGGGNDPIDGTTGDDTVTGTPGDDVIRGLGGNDTLIGGGGADRMEGGTGDDFYFVDQAGDVVIELTGEGTDQVFAGASWTLTAGSHVEYLSTTDHVGTDPVNLTGNPLSQTIYGNAGANVLDGGGGGDVLLGGAGDDIYYIRDGADLVYDEAGQGTDRAFAATSWVMNPGARIEFLSTIDDAGTAAIDLKGSEVRQVMAGNQGANRLDGGYGSDTITGGAGADLFAFTTVMGSDNADLITDFAFGTDKLGFAGISQAELAAGAFRLGNVAQDADDRILYDQTTGILYYDSDGNGAAAAVQFATITTGLNLSANDFVTI